MTAFYDHQDAFRTITEEDRNNGLIIRWTGRYFASNNRTLNRIHNKYYLVYVYDGEGFVRCRDGEPEQILPGSIIFFRPGELQNIWAEKDKCVQYYGTCFCGKVIDSILKDSLLCSKTCHSNLNLDRKFISMFNNFINLMLLNRDEYDEAMLVSKFFGILARANTIIKLSREQNCEDKVSKASLEFVEQYLRLNYNKQITTEALVEISRYSVTWLEKNFKKEYGVSPMQYLSRIRLQKAKELLSTSEGDHLNIAEICYAIGYRDPFYFSKAFKKETRLSPRDFRMLYQHDTE
jgi:AraC-like DNA-binding protein